MLLFSLANKRLMPSARLGSVVVAGALFFAGYSGALAADTSSLQSILAGTPEGGWVQVNTNSFSSAWATQAQGGLPPGSYSDPGAIVRAWSGFAWDSTRSNLVLWGGGHGNYMGNEVYLWSATTGQWSRGSLPSTLIPGSAVPGASAAEFFVSDGQAPQSAHTYENLVYLPGIDRVAMMGGAAFNTGGGQRTLVGGVPTTAGPWYWDPSKADANKVGGTTGSGYLATTVGGNMWTNRVGQSTGAPSNSPLEATTAYRMENGRDVIYQTRDSNASGFPSLYRFTAGDPDLGQLDSWEKVAVSAKAANYQSSGAIDLSKNLYVRTAFDPEHGGRQGLGVWDLSKASAANVVGDKFINLELGDGSVFQTNTNFAISYDEVNKRFVLWDGESLGTVYYVAPEYLAGGGLDSTWTVTKAVSTTIAQPRGNFNSAAGSLGVLGKWQYIAELDAFMALDSFNNATQDAGVWLYKPLSVTAVPEPMTALLMGLGLAGLLLRSRISSRQE